MLMRRTSSPTSHLPHLALFAIATVFAACDAPSLPNRRDSGVSDATVNVAAPTLEALPARVPFPVIAIRGRAPGSRRVLLRRNGGNPLAISVLPDGTFCRDIRIDTIGSYAFDAVALSSTGASSPSSAAVNVAYDPAAPRVPGAMTCGGADPNNCIATEICGNNTDDDCDGRRDSEEPQCAQCVNDTREPNDSVAQAPVAPPGLYSLKLCPGDKDFFSIFARENANIVVRATFLHSIADVDLELYAPGGETPAVSSEGTTNEELLQFRTTSTGNYVVSIFPYSFASPADAGVRDGGGPVDGVDYALQIMVNYDE